MAGQRREAVARGRYLRASATKYRYLLDQIRGKHVEEARRVLQFSSRGAAREVAKILNAAVANAENTLRATPEELYVARAWADEGPTLKRWHPRALGRAYRIRRRTAHVTLIVEPMGGTGGTEG